MRLGPPHEDPIFEAGHSNKSHVTKPNIYRTDDGRESKVTRSTGLEGPLAGLRLEWNETSRSWTIEFAPTGLLLVVDHQAPLETWNLLVASHRSWARAQFIEVPLARQLELEAQWKEDQRRENFWELVKNIPGAKHHGRLQMREDLHQTHCGDSIVLGRERETPKKQRKTTGHTKTLSRSRR